MLATIAAGVGTFLIYNFGCRATQADGAALGVMLSQQGFVPGRDPVEADVVILNTCTVTASADEDARQLIRRIHRLNPAARIIVTGCYAQRAPELLAELPGVVAVVGNSDRHRIPELVNCLDQLSPGCPSILVREILTEAPPAWLAATPFVEDRVRPNLKIQEGCSRRCSYCVIPFVRGPSRSLPADEVVRRVASLSERYCEIVLSGVDLGRWGRDLVPRQNLAGLVERLLRETPVQRLRLSSVEPLDWTDELLELMASSPRIARHVHAPLQSGSDAVLRRMRRRYRIRHYAERIWKARKLMPAAAIGADVMVGFPGETDREFQETVEFIRSMPFTYLHVFTFSSRPGTEAASLPGQVPLSVRKERNRILRELAAEKNREFRQRMVGQWLSVVTLGQDGLALSDNYVKVKLARPREPNRIVDVYVGGLTSDGVEEALQAPAAGS